METFEFNDELLMTYDDETLVSYIRQCPRTKESGAVYHLSPNLIVKAHEPECEKDGVKAMEIARDIGVRAPNVKRIVELEKSRRTFVIMEKIHGSNLYDCWQQLGWLTTFKLAFQLRGYIRRMRTLTSPTVGGLATGITRSIWIEDDYRLPLYANSKCLAAFLNFWCNYDPPQFRNGKTFANGYHGISFPPDQKLVFTHQDLAPRNMLIDSENRLWLVDWDFSGWFPIYFEYAGMQNFGDFPWTWLDKLRWRIFSWISVGVYKLEKMALSHARHWFLWNPTGRQHEVLMEGAGMNDIHLRRPGI